MAARAGGRSLTAPARHRVRRANSTLRMAIISYEAFKARTVGIANGTIAPDMQAPVLWFPSVQAFATLLSETTLAEIALFAQKPGAVTAPRRENLCRYNLLRRQGRCIAWKTMTLAI